MIKNYYIQKVLRILQIEYIKIISIDLKKVGKNHLSGYGLNS